MTVTDKVLTYYILLGEYKIPTPIYVNTEYIGLILSNFHLQENATFPVKLSSNSTVHNGIEVFQHVRALFNSIVTVLSIMVCKYVNIFVPISTV